MSKSNIWQQLPKPIFALAPMEDVTDTVFRQIVVQCGKPDIMFTEFTNATGMFSDGQEEVRQRLLFAKEEKPLIAQIWGENPEDYYKAAAFIQKQGFDGIDINMGCPVKKIISKGCCSALINNHSLAKEIIQATKEGANGLPVSVKTRIGFKTIVTEDWISFILEQDIDALTIHGRIVREQSKGPNHWEEIAKAPAIRDALQKETVIIGNGDVKTLNDAKDKAQQYNLDGIMIGRGIFDNPWLFNRKSQNYSTNPFHMLPLFKKHIDLFEKTWGKDKNFAMLKKFVKMYVKDFTGAAQARVHLLEANDTKDLAYQTQTLFENLPKDA